MSKGIAIIMADDSVRAILAGHKTETRRVLNPQPLGLIERYCFDGKRFYPYVQGTTLVDPAYKPRYLGHRLWVKEAWQMAQFYAGGELGNEIDATYWEGPIPATRPGPCYGKRWHLLYRATGDDEPEAAGERWRPALFMPQWAARLWLLCVDEQIERLQAITEDGALREGMHWRRKDDPRYEDKRRDAYRETWDMLNAKRGYAWDTNPWVRVVRFRVLTTAEVPND